MLSSRGGAFNVVFYRLLFLLPGVVAIAAAPVMDESAVLAVGNTSFGGKDECVGLKFFAGAFAYL